MAARPLRPRGHASPASGKLRVRAIFGFSSKIGSVGSFQNGGNKMTDDLSHIDESVIAAFAGAADLPLSQERASVIAKPLAAWLADANELSRKMSQAGYLDLMPVSIFSHPPV
jgi:hypothetical protein